MKFYSTIADSLKVFKDGSVVATFIDGEFETYDKELIKYLSTIDGVFGLEIEPDELPIEQVPIIDELPKPKKKVKR
jgi:hypothetical protein